MGGGGYRGRSAIGDLSTQSDHPPAEHLLRSSTVFSKYTHPHHPVDHKWKRQLVGSIKLARQIEPRLGRGEKGVRVIATRLFSHGPGNLW